MKSILILKKVGNSRTHYVGLQLIWVELIELFMDLRTSPVLINRLKNISDEDAWNRFFDIYSPLILAFARQKGCNESLAEDVLQETMCQLLQYMVQFDYNPERGKFRSYLLQVVSSRIRRLKNIKVQTVPIQQEEEETSLDFSDTRLKEPWEEFDKLWKNNLMVHAFARVQKRVNPSTWKSFELFVIEKKSTDRVAKELNMTKNTVYKHKKRVMDLVEEEIKNLEQEIGDF